MGRDRKKGKLKYKDLKKRMKKPFKKIRETLSDGKLPPADTVRGFLADSALMVSCKGYGDEYYEAYNVACERFGRAFQAGDLSACWDAADELERLKSDCHDRYK